MFCGNQNTLQYLLMFSLQKKKKKNLVRNTSPLTTEKKVLLFLINVQLLSLAELKKRSGFFDPLWLF